jgi:hypothetical protein
MSKRIDDLLASEGEAAESFEEDQAAPYPDHVKITGGNPRSKVLQVRLNPDEMAALERIVERRGLPVSTIAREQLLKLITDEDTVVSPLGRLIAAADTVKALANELRNDQRNAG